MTYYRDYVKERLDIIRVRLGEQMFKLNEEDIKKSIQSTYTQEELNKLNNAVITISTNGKNTCSLRCKSILLKSIPYSEIQWYCDIFDQYVLETNTIDEAIELFRDENPVNNNIAVGTAKGRIRSKFNELKEEANQYGFNLVDFIEEAGLNSDYFE